MTDYSDLMEDCVIDGMVPPTIDAVSLGDYTRALRAGFPVVVDLSDMSKWPRTRWRKVDIDKDWESQIPEHGGVYAIYVDGDLNYIGSTNSLIRRLTTHLRHREDGETVTPWGHSRNVAVKFQQSKRFADWLTLEARLIAKIQPPRNKKVLSR